MVVTITNAQHRTPVSTQRMAQLARCAIRRLRIRTPGTLAITFVNSRRMRVVNQRFLHHDRTTDVISFRYDGESTAGEILIDPSMARRYAKAHGVPYPEELARYVVHGLLHWLGRQDRTAAQQRQMRRAENDLLMSCGFKKLGTRSQ